MSVIRALARPALAGYFVVSGVDAFRHPKEASEAMDAATLDLARRLGLPDDPVRLTRLNGAAQAASGAMLALGRLPRVSSAVLLATMVPSNLIGPRYWEVTDPQERARQRTQFFKNVAVAGGLLLGVADTAGRPSVGWWAQRAARRTAAVASAATAATSDAASGLFHGGESLASGAAAGLTGAVATFEQFAASPKNRRRAKHWRRSAKKSAHTAANVAARDLAIARAGLRTEAGHVAEAARSVRASGAANLPRLRRQTRRHRRHATKAARTHLHQARVELARATGSAKGSAEKVLAGMPHHLGSH